MRLMNIPERLVQSRQFCIDCLAYSTLLFISFSIIQEYDHLYRAFFFAGIFPLTLLLLIKHDCWLEIKQDRLFLLILFLLISLYISVFWSDPPNFWKAVFRHSRWCAITLVFVVGMFLYGRSQLYRSSGHSYAFQIITMLAALVAIYLYFSEAKFPQRLEGVGLLDHPIMGSAVLISVWALSLAGADFSKVGCLALTLTSLVVVSVFVILSQSRGPILALCFVWVGCIWVIEGIRIKAAMGAALVLVVFLVVNYFDLYAFFMNLVERGDSYRITIWRTLLSNTSEFFWTGIGIATDLSSSPLGRLIFEAAGAHIGHPHNLFLSMWVYGGLVPLLLSVAMFCVLIRQALRLSGQERAAAIVIIGAVLLLCFTDTHKLISSPQELWLIIWLPIGLLSGRLSLLQKGSRYQKY